MKTVRWGSLLAGLALLLLTGCAHQLEVKNLRQYQNTQMQSLDRHLEIGIIPGSMSVDELHLVKGIGSNLGRYSAKVLLPYSPDTEKPADVEARIGVHSSYYGSGWNFLINFPGFLIWAPAWNGYVYEADYTIDIALQRGSDGAPIATWSMPVSLNLRHADIDRTWTEISWLEVGVIAFIGGLVFIEYDSDVTPLLIDAIRGPIGDYIAQEIVVRINGSGVLSPPALPPGGIPAPASF